MSARTSVMGFARGSPRGEARRATGRGVYRMPGSDSPRRRTVRTCLALSLMAATSCQAINEAIASINVVPLADEPGIGQQAYDEILSGEQLVTAGPAYRMAQDVARRLVESARTFEPRIVDAFEWEVTVIEADETVNAFALPGGKMAVYTGILPVTQGETGLAVVMGHEIAHVTHRHGTKAMTRQIGAAAFVEAFAGGNRRLITEIGTGLLQLRYGRGAELEADREGLMYMARAGYDPREAVAFWTRMQALGGDAPPEWLSTHPAHDTRIDQLRSLLPEAVSIYEASRATGNSP